MKSQFYFYMPKVRRLFNCKIIQGLWLFACPRDAGTAPAGLPDSISTTSDMQEPKINNEHGKTWQYIHYGKKSVWKNKI